MLHRWTAAPLIRIAVHRAPCTAIRALRAPLSHAARRAYPVRWHARPRGERADMLDYLRRERCILSFGVLGFPGFIFGQRRGKGCLVRTVLTLDGGRGLKQPSSDVRWLGGRVESKYSGTLDR